MAHIAVSFSDFSCLSAAKKLAGELGLHFVGHYTSPACKRYTHLLLVTPAYIGLQEMAQNKLAPFYVDFLSPELSYRQTKSRLKDELLAKAIGCHPKQQPKILDATAGFGRDSFILASLGFEVTMIERDPIVAILLQDALRRGERDRKVKTIIAKLTLMQGDATVWLKQHAKIYDVIYLDPMFPKRKKSARVKKAMILLQNIVGVNEDTDLLFKMALSCAKSRVVIKRPRISNYINGVKPSYSLLGKHSRFDIYLVNL